MSGEVRQIIPAESVTPGHPDKLADHIVAHVVDEVEEEAKTYGEHGRSAVEVGVKADKENGGTVFLSGEVTIRNAEHTDQEELKKRIIEWAKEAIRETGYKDPKMSFTDQSEFILRITPQSTDIDHGVTKTDNKIGYGDQGIFIGGAILGETPELMPMPIMIARFLTNKMYDSFITQELPWIKPDGKAQVGVEYVNGIPVRIANITIAASHDPLTKLEEVKEQLHRHIIDSVSDEFHIPIDKNTKIIINGAGPWTIYGPLADSGWANRKLVVDTYGGWCQIGGGGFCGKDPTKADVMLQLASRWSALKLVTAGDAKIARVRISCTIGQTEIDSLDVDTEGTGRLPDDVLANMLRNEVDYSIGALIERFHMYDQKTVPYAQRGWIGIRTAPWELSGIR